MPDTTDRDPLAPATTADLTPPPATTELRPAAPLKNEGVSFEPDSGDTSTANTGGRLDQAKQALRDNTAKVRDEATDKARSYAIDGKDRATGALSQLSTMLNDAAGQVDEKLGSQYGQYARSAADRVSGLSSAIEGKDVDELVDDLRALVRKSPAVAIGTAAALGFVVARLLTAGVDQREA